MLGSASYCAAAPPAGSFRAGASAVDISPRTLPAIRNGGFLEASSDRVDDPLHARSLVLSDGRQTLGIVIVDSCMIPRDVCDEIKRRATRQTGIPTNRLLIAATHTHSAPSLMDYCLGSRKDAVYTQFVIPRIVEGIVQAHGRLEPAEAAWAAIEAPDHTHCRRWLHRPGTYARDPFGEMTVRAMMHPGYENPAFLEPAGPVDTTLTVLSVRSTAGRPLCVLANYSMHYFGAGAGFFGGLLWRLCPLPGSKADARPGRCAATGGHHVTRHQWRLALDGLLETATGRLLAAAVCPGVGRSGDASARRGAYRQDVELAMAETTLELSRRLPSAARLEWARQTDTERGDRPPRDQAEVYAQQALWLHEHPTVELVLQGVRVGELGLAAIPNEVYAITGLKLKAQSPLVPLMNLELANGACGYIPPPEQHYLGGYTTWPARTAGLEVDAEPRIVEAVLQLLEEVASTKRRPERGELYTDEQRRALEQARRDDNNRENRGQAITTAAAE